MRNFARRASGAAGLVAAVAVLLSGCAELAGRTDLPISDDFSGRDCALSEDDDEHIRLACEGGEYRVLHKRADERIHHVMPRRIEEPTDSASVEADVTLRAFPGSSDDFEAHGIGCWASPFGAPFQGYLFLVGPAANAFAILVQDETDETLEDAFFLRPLVDEASDAVVPPGETTRLRGECRATADGVDLTMYLDGKRVASASDSARFGPFEAFGFVTFSTLPDTDIRFDDFEAHALGD